MKLKQEQKLRREGKDGGVGAGWRRGSSTGTEEGSRAGSPSGVLETEPALGPMQGLNQKSEASTHSRLQTEWIPVRPAVLERLLEVE